MPVNTAALKTFAPAMRRQLLEAVGRKLDLLLNSQTPDTISTYAKQITQLRELEAENREQLLERVAYTWFNRLCALRYLDARGWHPFGCKVLMPAAEGETQPELLKLMRAGSLPSELKPHTNEARLHGLLDGQIPPAIAGSDPQGEVYRELVLASSRSYHQLLPELFEGLDDASELLLPDDLLSEGSIAGGFRIAISEEDCEDVEIIGWLYQFYISEKKDQVIGKVVKSEDIPAATQLFTPNWIVKYMVQNTIGAQWLATYPDSPLKGQMEFYIEPAEQTEEVKLKLAEITHSSLSPEEITLMDPACGSGHILVEAYEVLKAIYLEQGYQLREIPKLIFEKNLFGLDIDERAVQLSVFALLMKGREDDRRLLERGARFNVMALQDSTDFDAEEFASHVNPIDYGLQLNDLRELKRLLRHATTFGSLIQVPEELTQKLPAFHRLSEATGEGLFVSEEDKRLRPLVQQAELLAGQYDAVVANPPYMAARAFPVELKDWLKSNYRGNEKDLFSAFIPRMLTLARPGGYAGVMTSFVWMFIATFEQLRRSIVVRHTINSLVQLHYDAFADAKAHICTFVLQEKRIRGQKSAFIRLADFPGVENQGPKALEAIKQRDCGWFYEAVQDDFASIPGSPVAYWIRNSKPFDGPRIGHEFESGGRTKTHDNERFLRFWWEVERSLSMWAPFANGGDFRKYTGNDLEVVNWSPSATAFYDTHGGLYPEKYWGKEGITWGLITSATVSFRVKPANAHYSSGAPTIYTGLFCCDRVVLAFLNSPIAHGYLKAMNPTVNTTVNDVLGLPMPQRAKLPEIELNVDVMISLSKSDWDAYERSWDFMSSPLATASAEPTATLEIRYISWITQNREIVADTKRLEEENNRLFIDKYGLESELAPEVPLNQITLTVNPAYRYGGECSDEDKWSRFQRDSMAELISYATGCMMGRYSLDHPGLILADSRDSQAEQLSAYETKVGRSLCEVRFKPDPDGIIPVLDGEWFEDDIVARSREFLAVTFPESSVAENLRFIEESLGKDIRKYFCSEFYKDHLQTYKKRPIYWLVQSPKKGFSCLIYLHRYTKDTLNQVLNNYFRPYLQKLEARLAQLGLDQLNDDLPARERTAARKEAEKITKVLKECQAWEQDALLPLAQQRIELDLDDGVKVNYLKLQDVLAPIPGLAAKED